MITISDHLMIFCHSLTSIRNILGEQYPGEGLKRDREEYLLTQR